MQSLRVLRTVLPLLTILFAGCTPTIYLFPTGNQASAQPSAAVANPAAQFCEQNDGQHVIQTGVNGGQAGYCIFIDRSYCEDWSYFNGECRPGEQLDADRVLIPTL